MNTREREVKTKTVSHREWMTVTKDWNSTAWDGAQSLEVPLTADLGSGIVLVPGSS